MQQGGEGASKGAVRLEHLDDQGVWGEVVYPSLGLWYGQIDDPHLVVRSGQGAQRPRARRAHPTRHRASCRRRRCRCSRWSCRSKRSQRCADLGFRAVFLPTEPREAPTRTGTTTTGNQLWTAIAEAGLGRRRAHRHRRRRATAPTGTPVARCSTTSTLRSAVRRRRRSSWPRGALERHPDAAGADLGRRRDVGAVRGRPSERGVPPAPDVRRRPAPEAAEGVHHGAGVRVVPARRDRGAGVHRDGLPQHPVRHRLPAHRGHVPAHAEGAGTSCSTAFPTT